MTDYSILLNDLSLKWICIQLGPEISYVDQSKTGIQTEHFPSWACWGHWWDTEIWSRKSSLEHLMRRRCQKTTWQFVVFKVLTEQHRKYSCYLIFTQHKRSFHVIQKQSTPPCVYLTDQITQHWTRFDVFVFVCQTCYSSSDMEPIHSCVALEEPHSHKKAEIPVHPETLQDLLNFHSLTLALIHVQCKSY